MYFVLVAKNHQKFRSRYLVREFFFTYIFKDINHGLQSSYIEEKLFLAASLNYGCGYLLLL